MKVLLKVVESFVNERACFSFQNCGEAFYIGSALYAKGDQLFGRMPNYQKKYINDVKKVMYAGAQVFVVFNESECWNGVIDINKVFPTTIMNGEAA